jgi:o-succinylbenzoate synthase
MTRVTRLFEQRFRFFDAEGDRDKAVATDARRTWSERRTLVVAVEDADGQTGLGEAAPLPGYSPDSIDDAWTSLEPLIGKNLTDRELGAPGSSRELIELAKNNASPSARFALESAMLDLWSRRGNRPAWALLARIGTELGADGMRDAGAGEEGPAVAALLAGDAKQAQEQAERAVARRIACFKLKVGAAGAWARELGAIRAVRWTFPEARLRVDANQCFSPLELAERLPALRELALDWIEEPTPGFLEAKRTELDVPVALDESLQKTTPNPTQAWISGVRAYVLKPTAIGGFMRCFELARSARSEGIAVVVSHAYEGPVGYSALAALALALGSDRPPDGLDSHAGLTDSPDHRAFDAENGRIRAWTEPGFALELARIREQREVVREVRA